MSISSPASSVHLAAAGRDEWRGRVRTTTRVLPSRIDVDPVVARRVERDRGVRRVDLEDLVLAEPAELKRRRAERLSENCFVSSVRLSAARSVSASRRTCAPPWI